MYQFGCTGDPEEATKDLPFIALDSGQPLAIQSWLFCGKSSGNNLSQTYQRVLSQ